MILPQQFRAKLSDKTIINPQYSQYFFELLQPSRMEFLSGQYISLALPEGGQRRSYSLCSSPEKDHGFELLIDSKPNGLGIQYLNSLQFGDEISFLSPLGLFTLGNETEPISMIATGSGIAPFRSMILDLLQIKKSTQDITLYWGQRFVDDLFWEEELEELCEDFAIFHFHPVISKAPVAWPLCQGRVTDCLRTHQIHEKAHFYICGSDTMITDVMHELQTHGISKHQVHREKFF